MFASQFRTWPDNAILSNYHHPVDPTRDWVPSPRPQPLPLPSDATPIGERDTSQAKADKTSRARQLLGKHDKDANPSKRRGSRLSLRFWRDRLRPKQRKKEAEPLPDASLKCEELPAHATPADWRAYGYWARPVVHDVIVSNATPPRVPRKLDATQVEAVIQNLLDEEGAAHPERWISGLEHPCLPPRPSLWPPLSLHSVPLLSSELQLNPFLEHRRFGTPSVIWDMRLFTMEFPLVALGEMPSNEEMKMSTTVWLNVLGPNGAQPATYPGVSSIKITVLADDSLPVFPWPFIVNSHHDSLPVTVHDVLCAIKDNFKERMTQEEVNSLRIHRKYSVIQAYWARTDAMCVRDDDGVRRVDYLGSNYMFRGLEPGPDGGFMLYVGPP